MICPDGKILNPDTGRCVLRTGKIGQKVLATSNRSTSNRSTSNTCTRLTETYNTNILKSASKIEQAVFYMEAEKHAKKGKGKGNTTLIQLINNHRLNKEPSPKFIEGPFTLSLHYNEEYQLTVYTFGERHLTTTDCPKVKDVMPIEDFLQRLLYTTSSFIDIYVEWPTFKGQGVDFIRKLERDNSYNTLKFGKIALKLKECVVPHTRHDKICDLVRVHHIDIRQGEKDTNPISKLMIIQAQYDFFQGKEGGSRDFRNFASSPYGYGDILKKLSNPDIKVYQQYLIDQIILNPSLLKELNKSFLKDKIMKFGIEFILRQGNKFRSNIIVSSSALLDPSTPDNMLQYYINSLDTCVILINFCIVDMYTLARIFKKFNVVEKSNQPISPHNIIIYAGELHSINYRKFLESIGSKKIAHAGPRDINKDKKGMKNCVDLSGFPMPFFRN